MSAWSNVERGFCPMCGGKLTPGYRGPGMFSNMRYLHCMPCGGGVPAMCGGTIYMHNGGNLSDCGHCGENNPSMSNHNIAMR